MDKISIIGADDVFSINFYDFKKGLSSDYCQFKLKLASDVFNVLTTRCMRMEELIEFRENLDLMCRKQLNFFSLNPLGEFWILEFSMKEGNIYLKGVISDMEMPQSELEFYNVVRESCLAEIIIQIGNILDMLHIRS